MLYYEDEQALGSFHDCTVEDIGYRADVIRLSGGWVNGKTMHDWLLKAIIEMDDRGFQEAEDDELDILTFFILSRIDWDLLSSFIVKPTNTNGKNLAEHIIDIADDLLDQARSEYYYEYHPILSHLTEYEFVDLMLEVLSSNIKMIYCQSGRRYHDGKNWGFFDDIIDFEELEDDTPEGVAEEVFERCGQRICEPSDITTDEGESIVLTEDAAYMVSNELLDETNFNLRECFDVDENGEVFGYTVYEVDRSEYSSEEEFQQAVFYELFY